MKCATCGAWSLVKETRGDKRRRECANGHRFTTIETLLTEDRRKVNDRERVRSMARARRRAGEPCTVIALQLGVSESTVRRWVRPAM